MKPESQIAHIRGKTRPFESGPYLSSLMAELDRAQISARMKQSREQAGLKQREIADLLHSHWRTVQEWENVKNPNVPWDRLDDWAHATGVRRDWLLTGDDRPVSEPATVEEIRQVRADVAELRDVVDRILELLLEQDDSREKPAGF
jgi:transcriptional regulator with XRE-family HTH domain